MLLKADKGLLYALESKSVFSLYPCALQIFPERQLPWFEDRDVWAEYT